MKVDLGINPKYVKAAIWIVVAIVAVIVIRKIWKSVSESIDRNKLVNKMGQDVNPEEVNYSDAQYLQWATTIKQALTDTSSGLYGVNQDKIYEVYRNIKSPSDLLKLHLAFGSQTLNQAWTHGNNDGTYTLAEALPVFLSKGELRKVNKILLENGVNFSY